MRRADDPDIEGWVDMLLADHTDGTVAKYQTWGNRFREWLHAAGGEPAPPPRSARAGPPGRRRTRPRPSRPRPPRRSVPRRRGRLRRRRARAKRWRWRRRRAARPCRFGGRCCGRRPRALRSPRTRASVVTRASPSSSTASRLRPSMRSRRPKTSSRYPPSGSPVTPLAHRATGPALGSRTRSVLTANPRRWT